jgi:hypothetical protein
LEIPWLPPNKWNWSWPTLDFGGEDLFT